MYTFQDSGVVLHRAYQLTVKQGNKKNFDLNVPAVIFITKGEISLFLKTEGTKNLTQGQIFILPRDAMSHFDSLTDVCLTVIEVPDMTALATYFFPGLTAVTATPRDNFTAISMDKLTLSFHDTLCGYMNDKMLSGDLIRIKVFELFYIFSNSLSDSMFRMFFSPVINDGYTFAQFVLTNYTKVKNAEELAALSNYSLSGFEKQFRKIFGIAPYKWMLQQKAQKVFHEILQSTKPLKVIAEEYDFCNISHLGDFCRKHFGASPSYLRDKNKL